MTSNPMDRLDRRATATIASSAPSDDAGRIWVPAAPVAEPGAPAATGPTTEAVLADATPTASAAVAVSSTSYGRRVRELLWLAAGLVAAFLALDFVLRGAGAPLDGFTQVVERVGGALGRPFAGLFAGRAPMVGHTTAWSLLLAIAVYGLAALVVARVIHAVSPRSTTRVTSPI